MGLLKKEISQEFIVVPDNKKGQIVFKWPDVSIRRFSKAIVNADEIALFVNTGQVIGVMPPDFFFPARGGQLWSLSSWEIRRKRRAIIVT